VGAWANAVKILFAALHNGYYRNLESVVEELARRGHDVFLGAEREDSALGGSVIVERLAAAHPNVTFGAVPRRERRPLFFASRIRLALDYLRYLEPEYAATPALRRRAELRTPTGIVAMTRSPLGRIRAGRRLIARSLDRLDHAVEQSPAIEQFLDEQRPDAVMITPLIGLVASSQLDLLRSAQARRIPTAVCVWSWDHLSSKAIIRDLPDRLFVWNNVQRQEAIDMHGVPPERIAVTGAQNFDRWFARVPSRTRQEFAARVGLPDDRPYVLWVCSALFQGSPSEADFVMRWVGALRAAADPAVRNVNVLIRPHPSRTAEWETTDWRQPGVALWGANPIDEASRGDYFDSLHYSDAVVGLNTSAFIEAGIAGRPVMAVLTPEFHENQEGTLHFRYLLEVAGGLLTVARTLDEHARQLAGILAGDTAAILARQREFVREFVRPQGLGVPATGLLADEMERLAAAAPVATPVRPAAAAKAALWLMMKLERFPAYRRQLLDVRELEKAERQAPLEALRAQQKAEILAERRARREAERRAREQRLQSKESQRLAKTGRPLTKTR
jgi:hypothetical protein